MIVTFYFSNNYKLENKEVSFFYINYFIQQGYNNVKLFINVLLSEGSYKILSTTFLPLIIRNASWAANHVRMISEGSHDTENWSNDAENSALPSQQYLGL